MNPRSEPGEEAFVLSEMRLRPRAWVGRHLQGLLAALGRLSRAPLASFMTAAVIGLALALPTGLLLLLDNISQVSGRWQGGTEISIFLTNRATAGNAERLAREVRVNNGVRRIRITSPEDALREYRALGADPAVLAALGDTNPMPWILSVTLDESAATLEFLEPLATELRQDPLVELVEYDLRWLTRLHAMMAVGQRAAGVIALILAFGVLLVTGNTIRLEIERRRSEVLVLQVIGATNAFIRRPFLYTGMWYGVAGALLAAMLLSGALLALDGPVTTLAAAYESGLSLRWPGPLAWLGLLAAGAALGLFGAWAAVARYLGGFDELAAQDL